MGKNAWAGISKTDSVMRLIKPIVSARQLPV